MSAGGGSAPGGAGASPASDFRGWHRRGYLPHFDASGIQQAITFRLADSLPSTVVARLEREVEHLSDSERETARRKRVEQLLDAGSGECLLASSTCAGIVADVLLGGSGYDVAAWVIMPNHVHILIHAQAPLDKIVQAWKSVSSHRLNSHLGRTGSRWQAEYWDRYIRDERHFQQAKAYIQGNPVSAGLASCPSDWRWSSAYAGEAPAPPGAICEVGSQPS